jgi:mRNA interferase MazF
MVLRPYDIHWVELQPGKQRPFVILSPAEMNAHLPHVLAAPLTSKAQPWPTRVVLNHWDFHSEVAVEGMCRIGQLHIKGRMARLGAIEIRAVKAVLKEMLVD